MMDNEEKKWNKPELIVLVRNNPEETVLTGCKLMESGVAQNTTNNTCLENCGVACLEAFLS
jgi:hypothetical protein